MNRAAVLAFLALILWCVLFSAVIPWAWQENHPCEAHGGHISTAQPTKGRCVK